MWGLTPIRQRVTTAPNRLSSSVSGPAEFIKLAQDVLSLPYIYFKRGLLQAAAIGASFDVRFFDIDSESINPEIWRRIEASPQFKQGQWLVAKHIVPVRPEDMDLISTDPDSDRVRLASMVQEMRVLAHKPLLSHRNIVDLIGFSWERSKDESGRKWPILIMEAADCGSLDDFLRMTDPSTKSPDFAVSMALDIASGLEALHSCGVVHGDLKPDNILIFQISSDTFRAKISDFGFACLIEDLKSESQNSNAHPVGLPGFSPPWEAPEASADVLLEDLTKMDVYTFGLLACYLAASGGDIFAEFRLDDSDTTYNFDQIASLKNDTLQMANHAKKLVSSWIDTGSTQGTLFSGTIDLSLCSSPKDRADMVEIRVYLDSMSGDEISDVEMSE
jgi:serine/threonine protein kinase